MRFKPASETEKLVELFSTWHPGNSIAYEEVAKALDLTIDKAKERIDAARRIVLRNYGIVVERDQERGVYCANGSEVIGQGATVVRGFRRKAKKQIAKLGTVDPKQLTSDEERSSHLLQTGAFSAICQTLDRKLLAAPKLQPQAANVNWPQLVAGVKKLA